MPDEVKEQEQEDKVTCPCCGQPTLKRPVKVDSKIVDDYMASIITGEPFNHTFEMFDGKLKITASLASRDTGITLYRFVFLVEPYSNDSTIVRDLLGVVNAYYSIKKIIVSSKTNGDKVYFPSMHVLEMCRDIVEKWEHADLKSDEQKEAFKKELEDAYNKITNPEILSSTPPPLLTHVLTDFRALENVMLVAGFDENFWKGIELH